jgi:spore germination protein KA
MRSFFKRNRPQGKVFKQTETIKRLSKKLQNNIIQIQDALNNCCDLETRAITLGRESGINARVFFMDGMVDASFLAENVLKPLMLLELENKGNSNIVEVICNSLLPAGTVTIEKNPDTLIMRLLSGNIIILVENLDEALVVEAVDWEERNVEESKAETVVKGMRTSFVESIKTNRTLVRRIIKHPSLKIEKLTLGNMTNTEINIFYMENIVLEELVNEVKERLGRVDTDGIIGLSIIQETIDDSLLSIFSASYSTERPDRVCSCLLEGRVVIMMDNSPFAVVVPSIVAHLFQSPEDYNTKYITTSIIRLLRLVGFINTLILPGLYVAIFSYHHEMIPLELLNTVSQSREQLPFPIFLEMLMLEITFEILREAGIRLPRPVGQVISFVGAVVIGQATVSARLISPPSIIIVALTAVSSFTVPIVEGGNAIRMLRFPVLFAAGSFGLPGIISILLLILVHLSGLRSFGVPYLSPLSPFALSDWKDFFIRLPMSSMKNRPVQTGKANLRRQGRLKHGGR